MPTNIRLGWKRQWQTLAYFDSETDTAVKSFIAQAPGYYRRV
jgi:hypothetical protein